jgi:DNA-binding NtrC family response regulator
MVKILLAGPSNRLMTESKERLKNYFVIEANSGRETAKILKTFNPDIRIATTSLPKLKGLFLLDYLIKIHSTAVKIVLVGNCTYKEISEAYMKGASVVLRKPDINYEKVRDILIEVKRQKEKELA